MDERHYLTPLFEPQCVAIIGATEREGALGAFMVRNMLRAGFRGKLYAVNPKYDKVSGLECFGSIAEIPLRVDLAIIATPAQTVPDIIAQCGAASVRCAVVLSAGFGETGHDGEKLEQETVRYAHEHGLRLLGPNSLGLARPSIGLNATFAHGKPIAGSIGFISQSGALCAAMLDYASPNKVGFSSIVSMGVASDLDFGEVLDYMVWDWRTESILLYVEGIRDARRFLSALRAAARVKPIMVLKVGRHIQGSRAAQTHTNVHSGDDAVFDAALRRAGVVRLYNMSQLYAASKALFSHFHPRGNRLAIITNGGGPGVMAADRAGDLGIPLARLSPQTLERLNQILPPHWSLNNPVDLIGDSDPDRYALALEALLADEEVDGVLCLLAPQAMTQPTTAAERVVALHKTVKKPILTCWLGEEQCQEARELFRIAGIPTLRTPEIAVELFSHLSVYYHNQQLLTQAPAPLQDGRSALTGAARMIIEGALREKRTYLLRHEGMALLRAFHISTRPVHITHTAAEAAALASEVGYPVLLRPNMTLHGTYKQPKLIRQNLSSTAAVSLAFDEIHNELAQTMPEALKEGICIEGMSQSDEGYETMIRVWRDPTFGPVIGFGESPRDPEYWPDRAVALPPLNAFLAHDLINNTHAATGLSKLGGEKILAQLEQLLLRISEIVCELPWIHALELNPITANEHDVVVTDVYVDISASAAGATHYEHMAIHPYPTTLVTRSVLRDGRGIVIRPLKPEDAQLIQDFVRKLSSQTKFFRFMNALRELSPAMLAKLTQLDYDRELAFIAALERPDPQNQEQVIEEQIGVSRYTTNPDGSSCEFAIVVADEHQKNGLGLKLMEVLITTARNEGLKTMKGVFLNDNSRMLRFVENIGFKLTTSAEDKSLKDGVLDLAAWKPYAEREHRRKNDP